MAANSSSSRTPASRNSPSCASSWSWRSRSGVAGGGAAAGAGGGAAAAAGRRAPAPAPAGVLRRPTLLLAALHAPVHRAGDAGPGRGLQESHR
ncbi:MAG: hypothetical protein R2736_08340 [Solirubrobacterales bacterium]